MDSSSDIRKQSFGPTELNWNDLDKTKYYIYGTGIYTGITVALYPITVVKTRMQVASQDSPERSAYSVVKGLLKANGIPGLYKGLCTITTGGVAARILFITALENTKATASKMLEPSELSDSTKVAVASGVGGMIGTVCSQALFVPMDVVSQKLMVQGYSGHATYTGGLDVAHKVFKSDGIRGFYRGLGLSVLTYAPSGAAWWASYGAAQRFIWRKLDDYDVSPTEGTVVLVQAAGGVFAGAVGSFISTPLDTIKTRFQVIDHHKKPSAMQVVRKLIADEGLTGFYRGLGPRFCSVSAWGTSMILAYEYLKRICTKDELRV